MQDETVLETVLAQQQVAEHLLKSGIDDVTPSLGDVTLVKGGAGDDEHFLHLRMVNAPHIPQEYVFEEWWCDNTSKWGKLSQKKKNGDVANHYLPMD